MAENEIESCDIFSLPIGHRKNHISDADADADD